jgi:hypothetical protein
MCLRSSTIFSIFRWPSSATRQHKRRWFDREWIVQNGFTKSLSRQRDIVPEHRARFIQEGTDAEGAKGEKVAHVERIQIKEGKQEL